MPTDPAKPATELPRAHGPLGREHRSMQLVKEVFTTVESLRKARRFTVAELQPIVKTTRYSAVLVSKCDLEVIKALVASDMAPVVITRSPVGPKHVRVVVGYDDAAERIILTDPVNYTEARLQYQEFSKQWDDPRKSCLLVLSLQNRVSVDRIKSKLREYLSREKADSIVIKTSRKQ